jgi:hypothetical protein
MVIIIKRALVTSARILEKFISMISLSTDKRNETLKRSRRNMLVLIPKRPFYLV